MRSTGAKVVPCGLPGIMFPKSVGLRNRDFVGRVTWVTLSLYALI